MMKEISTTRISNSSDNKGSYDESDYKNYFEDKQECFNGSEQNPEFTHHHVLTKSSKQKEKSLKTSLKKHGFPPKIIAKADEIFSQMESGCKRGVRSKQVMFFCVLTAYNQLGIAEDPAKLATLCGITPSEMTKSFSMCSPSKTKFKSSPVHWTPKEFLCVYYQKIVDLGLISFSEESLNDIERICQEVMEKSHELRDEKPQSVAAAFLVFYLGLNGCAIDKKRYTEIFSKSEMTIQKIRTKIAISYNS